MKLITMPALRMVANTLVGNTTASMAPPVLEFLCHCQAHPVKEAA